MVCARRIGGLPERFSDGIDLNAGNAIIDSMASLTIRSLEPEFKEQLRVRAARHGRSMEEEARVILRSTIANRETSSNRLGDSIRRRCEKFGGVELELPTREPARRPPKVR